MCAKKIKKWLKSGFRMVRSGLNDREQRRVKEKDPARSRVFVLTNYFNCTPWRETVMPSILKF
jgi:hypothetical protein